jgi:hypothetical protein
LLSFLLVQVQLDKNNLRKVIKLELFVKNPCRHRSCARIVMTALMYPRQINKILDISCTYAVVGYCQNSNGGFGFQNLKQTPITQIAQKIPEIGKVIDNRYDAIGKIC